MTASSDAAVEFRALAAKAVTEMNGLITALLKRYNGHLSKGGAAHRSGKDEIAKAEFAKAELIEPTYNDAVMLSFQLNRAIIDWLDSAPDVAAAKASVAAATAGLKAEKDSFAATTDTLTALASALDGVTGVIKAVQDLLASPA